MESGNTTHNLLWLDGAFAKSYMDDEFEAACCLAGINKDNVRVDKSFSYYKKPSQIFNPIVSKLYEIVPTWITVLERKNHLLWFIEKAVINEILYVNYDLLLPECLKTEYRKKVITSDYPDLAEKLGLASLKREGNDQGDGQPLEQTEILWRTNAQLIYKELKLDKSKLSKEQKAKKVKEEMETRLASGAKGMTKRGGKEVPDFESIRRLALNDL